jgi:hypothetical protein
MQKDKMSFSKVADMSLADDAIKVFGGPVQEPIDDRFIERTSRFPRRCDPQAQRID